MKRLKFLLFTLIFIGTNVSAQRSVNSYEYIIVPVRYDFQKSDDQYQVNSLVKFLFEKEGFTVFLSNEEFPDELKLNRCLALTAMLNDKSKLFNTKMNFDFIDCDKNVLFSTLEGLSKEKDYKVAYFECVRESFESVKELNYMYEPIEEVVVNEEVAKIDNDVVTVSNQTTPVANTSAASTSVAVPVTATSVAVEKQKNPEPIQTTDPTIEKEQVKTPSDVLYAQPNANGFQVVDSSPKVVYMLLKTSKKDVFLLKDHFAIVYKDGDTWKVEYYKDEKLVVKKLNLKFF